MSLRYVYSVLLYVMLPGVLLRLWWRGRRVPGYRRHWPERLGWGAHALPAGAIWIHAVSVGEVRAAEPLVAALRARWPERPLLMTTVTPAGRQTVGQLFGPQMACCYLPYDLPGPVGRFLDRLSPAAALMMETEIWPNLYHGLWARAIPLLLVNARLSPRSLRAYGRLRALARSTIGRATHIAAQSACDAQRFRTLGADARRITANGNLKFDAGLPAAFDARRRLMRERLAGRRPVWVAGSTHPGEEMQVLAAHRRVLRGFGGALLLLAPRHPERAGDVARLCERAGLRARLYSHTDAVQDGVQVVVLDVLGELPALYGVADAAFVGGSLVAHGGHNPVEAVLAGAPVLSGPHVSNFHSVYEALIGAAAAVRVASDAELAAGLLAWFGDEGRRRRAAAAGLAAIARRRGATARVIALLEPLLQTS